MSNPVLEKTINVYASPEKIWRVFTDPMVTRQMGGEYVTDWQVGGAFGWKGKDGNMYTSGKILEIEPQKLLKHDLVDIEDQSALLSTITYDFKPIQTGTSISIREEINHEMDEEDLSDTSDGWEFALQAIKDIAEKL
ncbi:MAG: SRPBCC domain-containing protein [Chryseolinea sp.]